MQTDVNGDLYTRELSRFDFQVVHSNLCSTLVDDRKSCFHNQSVMKVTFIFGLNA
jgi:hypothetical protein